MTTVVLVTDARLGALVAAASGPVTALVVGTREVADAVASGADGVVWLGDPDGLAAEGWARIVADAVADLAPTLVLAADSPTGRVLAGAAAARLRAPIFAGVTRVVGGGDACELTRAAFGGIAEETLAVTGPAVVILDAAAEPAGRAEQPVAPGQSVAPAAPVTSGTEQLVAPAAPVTSGTEQLVAPAAPATTRAGQPTAPVTSGPAATPVTVEAAPLVDARVDAGVRVEVVEEWAAPAASDLGRARRIVAVGRGLTTRQDLVLVEELAAALGAEVACSRVLGDWLGHDKVVGLSGRRVRPELYVAVGISGQLQHVVGARASGTVVVVNSDPSCPYLAESDYAIVGDLYAILPKLAQALA